MGPEENGPLVGSLLPPNLEGEPKARLISSLTRMHSYLRLGVPTPRLEVKSDEHGPPTEDLVAEKLDETAGTRPLAYLSSGGGRTLLPVVPPRCASTCLQRSDCAQGPLTTRPPGARLQSAGGPFASSASRTQSSQHAIKPSLLRARPTRPQRTQRP